MVDEAPGERVRHLEAVAARQHEVTEVELHLALGGRLVDQVDEVVELQDEVEEGDDLGPIDGVE